MTKPTTTAAGPAWHVLGAGAMGCLWAARLWQFEPLGQRVTLLLRSSTQVEACRQHGGITLESALREQACQRISPSAHSASSKLFAGKPAPTGLDLFAGKPAPTGLDLFAGKPAPTGLDLFAGKPAPTGTAPTGAQVLLPVPAQAVHDEYPLITHLLVATKSGDVAEALRSVQARLTPQTRIVLLQNGVRVQREITTQYGAERVFCLSTSHGAWRREPFHVVHAGMGTAWLGQLKAADDTVLSAILEALPATAMHIHKDLQIAQRLWQKFAVNCAVNALTVIHDCHNGELLAIPAAQQDLQALVIEISALLAALPEVPPLPDLLTSVVEVLQLTAHNLSSTLQDARQGQPTELPDINGYLSELARRHGLESPLNDSILQCAEAIARKPVA